MAERTGAELQSLLRGFESYYRLIAGSSNGRTSDFGSGDAGSSLAPASMREKPEVVEATGCGPVS